MSPSRCRRPRRRRSASGPLHGFQVLSEVLRGTELLPNKRMLESAADGLNFRWLVGVVLRPSDDVVEDPYGRTDVVMQMLGGPPPRVIQVYKLDLKPQTDLPNQHVFRVQIAVVLAQSVDLLQSGNHRIQEVQSHEGMQPLAFLPRKEMREQFPLDVLAHKKGDSMTPKLKRILRVVLDENRAITESVQLSGVHRRCPIVQVALGEEQLGGALDAGVQLDNVVDFPFPAATKQPCHDILAGEASPRFEPKRVEGAH